jgi:hypothetical protein
MKGRCSLDKLSDPLSASIPGLGPCVFGRFGGWITVRCPPAFTPLMRSAGALWDPGHSRWCVVPGRIGPVIEQLHRFQRAGIRLD